MAPRNMRKHRLSSSDEEEFASSHEREFKRRERRAEEHAEVDDNGYRPEG